MVNSQEKNITQIEFNLFIIVKNQGLVKFSYLTLKKVILGFINKNINKKSSNTLQI